MKKDLYIAIIFTLSLITAFSLGYFSANLQKMQKPALVVEKATDSSDNTSNSNNLQVTRGGQGTEVVASVNSDKFHYLDCPGAKRIKEENKIYFESAAKALRAGFALAGNCK